MDNATEQRKKAMRVFDEIGNRNKNANQSEIERDIKKAIQAVRRLATHRHEF